MLTIKYISFKSFIDKIKYIKRTQQFNDSVHKNNAWAILENNTTIISLIRNAIDNGSNNKTKYAECKISKFGTFIITVNNINYIITKNEIISLWKKLSVLYITEFKARFKRDTEEDTNECIRNAIHMFETLLYIDNESYSIVFELPDIQ